MKPSSRTTASLAATAALLLPLTLALPASAAPRSYTYDAIGDSYAAGSGAPDGSAYPDLLNGRMRISLEDFAAVPGATAGPGGNSVEAQLGALDEDTDLVTLTIGGNDIPWGTTVGLCLALPDANCLALIEGVRGQITSALPATLDTAYAQVGDAAPNAHVVVAGYAHLFSPQFGDYTVPGTAALMSVAEQQAANDAADLLNATIAEAAASHGFEYVDVTGRFDGHGANADKPWINGVVAQSGGAFHPNAHGYSAYAAALTSAINPNELRR